MIRTSFLRKSAVRDVADNAPRVLQNEEQFQLGQHTLRWFDTPHLPHGWESGLLMDETTETLFCGDLFTQPGTGADAVTEGDILSPSETVPIFCLERAQSLIREHCRIRHGA